MVQANHEDKMGMARLYTTSKAPYSSTIVHGFIYVAMPGIGTMLCTDGMVLGYDPSWAETASVEELGADLYHEVNHFMRRHFWRRHVARPDLFNRAGDLAINPDLRNAGWKLSTDPKMGAIFPKDYGFPEGLTTEEYYDLLLKQEQQQQQEKKGGGGAGAGSAEAEGGAGPPKAGVCSGKCGSIAGGERLEWENKLATQTDVAPRTDLEVRAIEMRATQELRNWQEKQAKAAGRGNVPSYLSEFLKALEEDPVVSWQDELATITYDCVGMMQSGGDDYSLRRPSKRSHARGFPRPGLVEYKPEIAITLDTSGSMGLEQLKAVVREVVGIMDALSIDEIWWCEADAGVAQDWQRVHLDFFHELAIHGRGGTDFRPAIRTALELYPRPDLLFYGTDGDGTAPAAPPEGMEVIWLVVPGHWNRAPAPWGRTIFATDDKRQKRRFEEQHAGSSWGDEDE